MLKIIREDNKITRAVKKSIGGFREIALFSAVINLLALAPSIYMLQVYDRVVTSGNVSTLIAVTLILVLLLVVGALLEISRSRILVRSSNKLDLILGAQIYNASFENQSSKQAESPSQSIRDLTNLRQFVTGAGILAVFDVPWFPVYIFVLFLLHPWFAILGLVGGMVSSILAYVNDLRTRDDLAKANSFAISSLGRIDQSFRNSEVIRAMGMLPNLRKVWEKDHRNLLYHQAEASDVAGVWSQVSKYYRIFLQSVTLGLGAYLVVQGSTTPGVMIAGSILMGRALQPLDHLIAVWRNLTGAVDSYNRLKTLLEDYQDRSVELSLPAPKGELRLEQLNCVPPGAKSPSVMGADLRIEPGTIVGLIGPSGSGKSSLLKVMAGVWRPSSGSVRLDGADLKQWQPEFLGQYIGYMSQDLELFAGTVADNIARFGPMDSEAVIAAAKLAGVHELLLALPNGYDTVLGPQGAGLSGGQRQRLSLARALYGDVHLIILDEPNSNLDDQGDFALRDALTALKQRGCVVVVATHKTNLLQVTDALVVMRGGVIHLAGPTAGVLAEMTKPAQVNSKDEPRK